MSDTSKQICVFVGKTLNTKEDGWSTPIMLVKDKLQYKLEKDSVDFPYWEVDTYNSDDEWTKGNILLNHKITPECIRMSKERFAILAKHITVLTYDQWNKEEDLIRTAELEASEKIQESGILVPGYYFHTGVADGCSNYKVTKVSAKSVTVSLRKYGDGYRDLFLGCGRRLSMRDFNTYSFWERRAGQKPLALLRAIR
jgi:hypothetical protein